MSKDISLIKETPKVEVHILSGAQSISTICLLAVCSLYHMVVIHMSYMLPSWNVFISNIHISN